MNRTYLSCKHKDIGIFNQACLYLWRKYWSCAKRYLHLRDCHCAQRLYLETRRVSAVAILFHCPLNLAPSAVCFEAVLLHTKLPVSQIDLVGIYPPSCCIFPAPRKSHNISANYVSLRTTIQHSVPCQ